MKNKIIIISFSLIIAILLVVIFLVGGSLKKVEAAYPLYDTTNEIIKKQNEAKEAEVEIKNMNYAVPIYMYHWVLDDTGDYPYIENMVRPETLRQQVEYIANNGYESIFSSELSNLAKYTKPVMLTFDDGFESVYYSAYPIFKKYNVKATMFIISDYVDTPGYCTKEQLREMKESGLVELQCHTKTHPHLAEISREQMRQEMTVCNEYLKNEFNIVSDVICYPYGSRNNTTIEVAKECGFKYGLDMDGGIYYSGRDTDYTISRIYATRSMTLDEFIYYLNKSYVNVNLE